MLCRKHYILYNVNIEDAKKKNETERTRKEVTAMHEQGKGSSLIGQEKMKKYTALLKRHQEIEKELNKEMMMRTPVIMERVQRRRKTPEKHTYHNEEEEEEEEEKTTKTTKKRHSRRQQQQQQQRRNTMGQVTKMQHLASDEARQPHCCIIGCDHSVTNRLRFSLRCRTMDDFIPEYIERQWNKVCHYHYFSDLYKYKKKKMHAEKEAAAAAAATTTTTVEGTTTTKQGKLMKAGGKRKREASSRSPTRGSPMKKLKM